ncbi:MAG: DUF4258 domain-containing protein, partial [Saprospiraceae bacterium]
MDNVILSKHAKEQMEARGISEEQVWEVVQNPEQIIEHDDEKIILQYRVTLDDGKNYLIRVFINVIKDPNLIITVYKTG